MTEARPNRPHRGHHDRSLLAGRKPTLRTAPLAGWLALAATLALLAPEARAEDLPDSTLSTSPDGPPPALPVIESLHGYFEVGAGYDSYEGFLATAGVGHSQLFGIEGLGLHLDAGLSALHTSARLQANHRIEAAVPWLLEASLYADQWALTQDLPLGESRVGGQLGWGLELMPWLTVKTGVRLERRELIEPGALSGITALKSLESGPGALTSIWAQIEAKGEGEALGLGHRVRASLRSEQAMALSDDGFQFTRLEARGSYTMELPLGLELSFDGSAGVTMAPSARDIPLMERYRLGDAHRFGGFALPPTGPQAFVDGSRVSVGGTGAVLGRTTLAVPLWAAGGLYAVAGIEGGGLYDAFNEASGPIYNAAAFGGLRWDSPIGPMSMLWGQALTDSPFDQGPMFFFTLGGVP